MSCPWLPMESVLDVRQEYHGCLNGGMHHSSKLRRNLSVQLLSMRCIQIPEDMGCYQHFFAILRQMRQSTSYWTCEGRKKKLAWQAWPWRWRWRKREMVPNCSAVRSASSATILSYHAVSSNYLILLGLDSIIAPHEGFRRVGNASRI